VNHRVSHRVRNHTYVIDLPEIVFLLPSFLSRIERRLRWVSVVGDQTAVKTKKIVARYSLPLGACSQGYCCQQKSLNMTELFYNYSTYLSSHHLRDTEVSVHNYLHITHTHCNQVLYSIICLSSSYIAYIVPQLYISQQSCLSHRVMSELYVFLLYFHIWSSVNTPTDRQNMYTRKPLIRDCTPQLDHS